MRTGFADGAGYAGAQHTQMVQNVQAGWYADTSGKTGGTADKSLFVPGRFMDLPGTFCILCPAYIGNRYVLLQSILVRTNRQTEDCPAVRRHMTVPAPGRYDFCTI